MWIVSFYNFVFFSMSPSLPAVSLSRSLPPYSIVVFSLFFFFFNFMLAPFIFLALRLMHTFVACVCIANEQRRKEVTTKENRSHEFHAIAYNRVVHTSIVSRTKAELSRRSYSLFFYVFLCSFLVVRWLVSSSIWSYRSSSTLPYIYAVFCFSVFFSYSFSFSFQYFEFRFKFLLLVRSNAVVCRRRNQEKRKRLYICHKLYHAHSAYYCYLRK